MRQGIGVNKDPKLLALDKVHHRTSACVCMCVCVCVCVCVDNNTVFCALLCGNMAIPTAKVWKDSEREQLIDLVRRYPGIYDKSDSGHADKYRLQNTWEVIGEALDCTGKRLF